VWSAGANSERQRQRETRVPVVCDAVGDFKATAGPGAPSQSRPRDRGTGTTVAGQERYAGGGTDAGSEAKTICQFPAKAKRMQRAAACLPVGVGPGLVAPVRPKNQSVPGRKNQQRLAMCTASRWSASRFQILQKGGPGRGQEAEGTRQKTEGRSKPAASVAPAPIRHSGSTAPLRRGSSG
jgi:hypothetical protein